jgi:hypothetical protein
MGSLVGNRFVSCDEEIFVRGGSYAIALWWQEFDTRSPLVDPAIPNIDWNAEPMSDLGHGFQSTQHSPDFRD